LAANDRTKKILSEARILLNDPSRFKCNELDLYRTLNNVIREVYRAFGGFEKSIVFDVTDDASYSLTPYGEIKHKKFIATWDEDIDLLPPHKFWEYQALGETGNPYYATIFGDTLYIYPTPDFEAEDAETLTLHCVQVYPALPVAPIATTNVSVADPESPERHDEILAYAVASKYNPELREGYLEKLSEAIVDYHAKSLDQVIPDCEW
jgi:hypothetical protein